MSTYHSKVRWHVRWGWMPRYTCCMAYAVYILKCADGSLYTGITTDVARRLKEHRAGKGGSYTRSHAPRKIIYTETYRTRSAALKREAAIKRLSRSGKIILVGTAKS